MVIERGLALWLPLLLSLVPSKYIKKKNRKEKEKARKEKAKQKETDKANRQAKKDKKAKEEARQQLLKQRPSSVCELVNLTNLKTLTRKGSRTDGKDNFNCKVTIPNPNSSNWIKRFATVILMNNADINKLGEDFQDWATLQGTYGRHRNCVKLQPIIHPNCHHKFT